MLKNKILKLRSEGKTYSQIKKELNCAMSTISYHCSDIDQKVKTRNRKIKRLKQHPFIGKIEGFMKNKYYTPNTKIVKSTIEKRLIWKLKNFFRHYITRKRSMLTFTFDDVINKFSETPKCALTGDSINIYETSTYHFDHIIPVSRGGENTFDNLQICTKKANLAKRDLTDNEFIELCKKVLINKGYNVINPEIISNITKLDLIPNN